MSSFPPPGTHLAHSRNCRGRSDVHRAKVHRASTWNRAYRRNYVSFSSFVPASNWNSGKNYGLDWFARTKVEKRIERVRRRQQHTTNVIQCFAQDDTAGDLWMNLSSLAAYFEWVYVCVLSRTICLRRCKREITFLTWSAWHGVGWTSEPLIWHSYGNFGLSSSVSCSRIWSRFSSCRIRTIEEQFEQSKNISFPLLFCTFPQIFYFLQFQLVKHVHNAHRIHFDLIFSQRQMDNRCEYLQRSNELILDSRF